MLCNGCRLLTTIVIIPYERGINLIYSLDSFEVRDKCFICGALSDFTFKQVTNHIKKHGSEPPRSFCVQWRLGGGFRPTKQNVLSYGMTMRMGVSFGDELVGDLGNSEDYQEERRESNVLRFYFSAVDYATEKLLRDNQNLQCPHCADIVSSATVGLTDAAEDAATRLHDEAPNHVQGEYPGYEGREPLSADDSVDRQNEDDSQETAESEELNTSAELEFPEHLNGPNQLKVVLETDDSFASDSTGSAESSRLIQQWVDTCNNTHNCRANMANLDSREYPTRLLDLSNGSDLNGDLKLLLTSEDNVQGEYVTLSHCWGTIKVTSLTTDNLETFRRNIAYSSLPKTFQDVIVVTRRLEIKYLWIDSLCIIQAGPTSREDWLRESAPMASVYRNSFLNIGATGATDGSVGCFRDRDYQLVSRPIFRVPGCKEHPEFQTEYRLVQESFLEDTLLREPLFGRGWAFQERLLSPRMLHFGSQQIFWECREIYACESYPSHFIAETWGPHNEDPMAFEVLLEMTGEYRWHRLVREYGTKQLTKEEDKLIAISGVAEWFKERFLAENDRYLAGIWQSQLTHGLFWFTESGSFRPAVYRAPSWSWASVEGAIEYRDHLERTEGLYTLSSVELSLLSPSAPFGGVSSGTLKLECRLVPLQFVGADSGYLIVSDGDEELPGSQWYPDEAPKSLRGELICLPLSRGPTVLRGITVERIATTCQYLRTGYFEVVGEEGNHENDGSLFDGTPFSVLGSLSLAEHDTIELI